MKTAIDWATESEGFSYSQAVEIIKQIQRDAIKEGMLRAAEIVLARGSLSVRNSCNDHANAILTVAEKL